MICEQRLFAYASDPSPQQIRSKPTHLANLLAQRIASRSISLKEKNRNNMSDFILKFWPKSEVSESKIEQIKNTLKANNIISEEVIHWSGNSNKATNQISKYLDYDFEDEGSYSKSLIVKISENEYGVKEGEDDIETFDRKNVISIYEGDGSIINWIKFCGLLNSITGDEYEAGWEIL